MYQNVQENEGTEHFSNVLCLKIAIVNNQLSLQMLLSKQKHIKKRQKGT